MKVVVVGAGVVGLSSAYFLADAGHEVIVLERDEPGHAASSHNAGWLAPSMAVPVAAPGMLAQALRWMTRPDSPLSIRPSADPRYLAFLLRMLASTRASRHADGVRRLAPLAQAALDAYDRLRADGLPIEQDERPLLMLFADPSDLDAHVRELEELRRSGTATTWEVRDGATVRGRLTGASADVVGGISTWGDRAVDPVVLVRTLTEACRRRGVEIVAGAEAVFERDRGTPRLRHRDGTVAADAYVVAAGVWSDRVVRPLGQRLTLAAGKGYGFDVAPVAELAGGPLYLAEGRVAMTPYPDRLRICGTMEIGPPGTPDDPRRAGGILSSVDRYLPGYGLAATAGEPWSGLRPMTADGVPIVGRLRSAPSVVVATGHQMMGVTLGPATGILVSDLLTRGRADGDRGLRVR